jgi:hypothetical protein
MSSRHEVRHPNAFSINLDVVLYRFSQNLQKMWLSVLHTHPQLCPVHRTDLLWDGGSICRLVTIGFRFIHFVSWFGQKINSCYSKSLIILHPCYPTLYSTLSISCHSISTGFTQTGLNPFLSTIGITWPPLVKCVDWRSDVLHQVCPDGQSAWKEYSVGNHTSKAAMHLSWGRRYYPTLMKWCYARDSKMPRS